MLSFFRSETVPPAPAPDHSIVTAELPIPLEQSAPAEQRGWVDHLHGAVGSTWRSGSALGAKVAGDAVSVAGSALSTAGSAAAQIGGYGLDAAGLAATHASTAAKTVGAAAGTVGNFGLEAAEVAGRAVVEAGRYGGAAAVRVGEGAGWAASGVGRIGTGIIDGIVVTPATAATRSAAIVANAAIVQPAKAVKSFVLTLVFTICGTGAFIAACIAAAMFFYNGGMGRGGSAPVAATPPLQPMIIVLPQQGQSPSTLPTVAIPEARPEPPSVIPVAPVLQRAVLPSPEIPASVAPKISEPARAEAQAPKV